MKRLSISVTDWQYAALEEIARLDETSMGHVARDCLRGLLPQLLEVTRFLHDPHTDRAGALTLADDMERAMSNILAQTRSGASESDEVAADAPPLRRFRNRPQPPSSNTGVNPPGKK